MTDSDGKKNVNVINGSVDAPTVGSKHIELEVPHILGTLPGAPEGLLPASALEQPLSVEVPAWDNLPPENAIDKLSFQWRRQNTSNAFNTLQAYEIKGPLDDTDFPLLLTIDAGKLDYEEGPFDFRYLVIGHNGGAENDSKITPLVIDRSPPYKHAPPSALILPTTQITIPFFEAHGDEFVCVIPDYADRQEGDEVDYYWKTSAGSQHINRIPVPADLKIVYTRVQIEAAQNGECYAEYKLYDKAGNSSPISESVPIEVDMTPRSLNFVKVTGASGSAEYGKLNIDFAGDGVVVKLPADADIYEGEKVRLQWADPLAFNSLCLSDADPIDPLQYKVSKDYIAAHMVSSLADGAGYIPVYYEVLDSSGMTVLATSKVYNLAISDVLAANYPTLQCESVKGHELSLANVPQSGAFVFVSYWPFMADDQFLSFSLVGLGVDGKNLTIEYFTEHAVTEEEVTEEKVSTVVAKADLEKFKVGTQLNFEGRVSFNNKGYWYNFRREWALLKD